MRKFENIFCIVLLFATGALHAQDVVITDKLDKSSYLIGDYIHLNITIDNTGNYVFSMPAPESISSYDIISAAPVDTVAEQNKIFYHQEIIYSVYDSGNYSIPPITIIYKKPGDTATYVARADSIPFSVNTVPVDTTQAIKPIKSTLEVSVKDYTWYYIGAGAVAFVLLVFGLYKLFKRKKKEPAPVKQAPKSLYDHAMGRLKELEEKKLWQGNEIKQYYSELTEILREYMEYNYKINALESTSDEILDQLMRSSVSGQQISNISYILDRADLAKFAKSRPLPNENEQAMALAYQFIEATKPEIELNVKDQK